MCFTLSPWFLFLRNGIQIQKKAKPRDCSQSTRIFCSSSTYMCNCKIKLGFVSTCKMTKTEWVDSWQQPRCYSQWHWKWHLPTTLWCLGPRSPIKAHNQLVTWACCWVAWTTDLLKLWAKSSVKMCFLPDPGPIHCLTGPKALNLTKVSRPGNVETKLVWQDSILDFLDQIFWPNHSDVLTLSGLKT